MTTPTLDPHVFAHLQRQGVITADRVTKKPTTRACRDCHTPVIAALLDEATTRRLELNPAFLTPLGELQALTLDRATYQWTDGTITDREPWKITARPANTVRVLAEHSCHSPPFETGPDPTPPKQQTAQRPIDPPF